MPLYDYKCSKYKYVFEVQQRITDDPLKHCPKCTGHIKRLISAAGIIFKGSGFHVTDYNKDNTLTTTKTPTSAKKDKDKLKPSKKKKTDK